MLSKNKRGYLQDKVPFAKRFRKNLGDAFLGGQLTGKRTASLFQDAEAAGARGIDDLARIGDHNANRSLKRRLLIATTTFRIQV